MNARTLFCLALLLTAAAAAGARLTRTWTYQEMFHQADLVVIARPTATKDADERTKLLGDIPVVGVRTAFETRLVLKGPRNITSFALHHYRLGRSQDSNILNGPNLLSTKIDSTRVRAFLLFLRREKAGVYGPVTDQTDPDGTCIFELPGF